MHEELKPRKRKPAMARTLAQKQEVEPAVTPQPPVSSQPSDTPQSPEVASHYSADVSTAPAVSVAPQSPGVSGVPSVTQTKLPAEPHRAPLSQEKPAVVEPSSTNKGAKSLPKLDPQKIEERQLKEKEQKNSKPKKKIIKVEKEKRPPIMKDVKKAGSSVKDASKKAFEKVALKKKPKDENGKTIKVTPMGVQQNSTIALIQEKTIGRLSFGGKLLLGLLIPLLFVFAVVSLLVNSPVMSVRNIEVQGNSVVSSDEIKASLANLQGKPLAKVDKNDVLKDVVNLKQVQDVSVQAKPPGTLIVNVKERPESALVQDGDHYTVIDANGVDLREVKNRGDAKLPILDGGKQALNQDSFKLLSAVMHALPQDLVPQVDKISASSPTSALLTLSNGAKVHWGDSSQSEYKGQVLKALMGKNLAAGVQDYDVSSPERPTTQGGTPQINRVDSQPDDLPYDDGSPGGSQSDYDNQLPLDQLPLVDGSAALGGR